jgi:beta-glucanase (GH16 family)
MALTVAKLGKALAVQLRSVAANGDWRAAALGLADAIDPQPTPKPVPAPTPTPTPVNVLPVGLSDASLKLVWSDEFDGTWPDKTNWRQGERNKADGNFKPPGSSNGTPQANDEKQFYSNGQVSKSNSVLSLTASKRTVQVQQVASSDAKKNTFVAKSGTDADPDLFYSDWFSGTWKYQSGWASTGPDAYGLTDQSWTAKPSLHEWLYGVFEVKVKLPKGKGYWCAAWMLRSDGGGKDEIDLYEVVDPSARKIAHHYHCDAIPDWTKDEGPGRDTGVDLSADWHTVSVDWTPNYIRWYLDGALVQTTEGSIDPSNICKHPMYFILNLAVGGAWPTDPDSSTSFPQSLQVDYLRVWQRS